VLGLVSEIGNKKQARIIADGILRGVNLGQYCPQSARTLAEFAMHDWSPTVLPTLKYATQQHYRYLLDVHLLPALGDRRLCDISREAIQELLAAKLRSGLSWKTAKHIRGMVGRVLGCAEQWGYISENTALKTKLPRRGDRPKRTILTPEQIHLVLSDLAEPARSVALLLLLTGLRIGELLALRWSNVNLTARLIEVRETVYEGHFDTAKTGSSVRTIPIGPEAVSVLSVRGTAGSDPRALVFSTRTGAPLNRRNLLRRHLQPACKRLKLPLISWHSLRHSHATLLDAVGAPLGTVQAHLGHASPEVTRQVYLHSIPIEQRRAVESVEQLVIGPKWTQVSRSSEDGRHAIN